MRKSAVMDKTFGELIGSLIHDLRVKAGMTQLDLAIESFEDETKVRRIVELENGQTPRPQAKTLGPICETLNVSAETIAGLKEKAAKQDQKSERNLIELQQQVGKLSKALENLKTLTKDQLEALATRFEIPRAYDMSAEQLRAELNARAEAYRTYRAAIEAIDERTKGLGNLKAAAAEAADRLDFEEVENLLSRVDEVETEIAAHSKEIRARNALMRGRPEQAFTILSAAADSFGSVDQITPSKKRSEFFPILFNYGIRYDPSALRYAISLQEDALSMLTHEDALELWAELNNDLAIALANFADGALGIEAIELLTKSTSAYQNALTVFTKEDAPEYWATILMNLANTLCVQAGRSQEEQGYRLLQQALDHYVDALQIMTVEKHPETWATIKNNIASAYRKQAGYPLANSKKALLQNAVSACHEALTIRTKAQHPEDYALTLNNLGNALCNQAQHMGERRGAACIYQAIAAFRESLTVRTKETTPLAWAMTTTNLANAFKDLAISAWGEECETHLQNAEREYKNAQLVFTIDMHQIQWARISINLAILDFFRFEQKLCDDGRKLLQSALAHVVPTLTIFDPIHMAPDHTKATTLRDDILKALSD